MTTPYTGPGTVGSFGNDPASQEFIEQSVEGPDAAAWYAELDRERMDKAGDSSLAPVAVRVAYLKARSKRHSADLVVALSVVDCAADPRAFVQTLLRAGGKHVRNVEIRNE